MTKAVLASIQPKWCALILNGDKTYEVRRNRPKVETPFKVYIYCTNSGRPLVYGDVPCAGGWDERYTQTYGYSRAEAEKIWEVMNGKVIAEFTCDAIEEFTTDYRADKEQTQRLAKASCLTWEELAEYEYGSTRAPCLFAWHISDLHVYDEPLPLSDFLLPCVMPESQYCPACEVGYEYISEEEAEFLRVDGECQTEWVCLNRVKRPPQSWQYIEERRTDNG